MTPMVYKHSFSRYFIQFKPKRLTITDHKMCLNVSSGSEMGLDNSETHGAV